ncbi:lysosome-associated membrane glycoprotein 2 isoform X2 [Rana temporaria]|uniref:lysosome-associated membrane glycoprotein 2 isoform X2 n=1 Tax=Rana temporaria TaxID=8407 RepID=UPI001AADBD51|nr:lysosome-associated membrane glycoprotein 2 isoform X2 [Rana temporaria]
MDRYLCYVTLCLLGLGLLETNAFEVEIKDSSNTTCIYANLRINFTVEYETSNGTFKNVSFAAPDEVNTEGSSCGQSDVAPLLNVHFGNGNLWSLNFTKNDNEYRGSVLSFTYNASDSVLFPDAKEKGLVISTTNTSFFVPVPLNSSYKCLHDDTVTTPHVVQVYWNVTLKAYIDDSAIGKDFTCSADLPSTTQSPTTHSTTIPSTTTTPQPTTKPVDKPSVGNYTVLNGTETCLLASMGLQLNASLLVEGKNVWTALNIDPINTNSSGTCGNETALLRLTNGTTVVEFLFFIKEKNFHLQEVNVTLFNGSDFSSKTNLNLSLWEASLGNSYLCRKEQLITVSEDLYINTFDVRVQPFNLKNGTFGTASECHLDDDSILIPIIVGAALSGLIVIIVIAYLIGRRKTYAGYQTI